MSSLRSQFILRSTLALLGAGFIALADGPVVSAFQNRAGMPVAVAGDVIDLLGSNLMSATQAGRRGAPQRTGFTTVFCDRFAAPILSVEPDRVRIQLPWELAGLQATQIKVVNGAGTASATFNLPLSEFGPAILGLDAEKLTPGQTLTLRVIGLGPRSNNPATGESPTVALPGAAFVRFVVQIGGAPAPIVRNALATGQAQSDAGVQDVVVQVPYNIPTGANVPMQVQIAGVSSPVFPVTVQEASVQLALSPASAAVAIGGSFKFTTSVQGSSDTKLTWSLDPNGYSTTNSTAYYGSINSGVFTATYNGMPYPNWAIVRATHSSGAFATALVQLIAQGGASYRIVPDSPVIASGESVSLSLVGSDGTPVTGVSWSISDGYSSTTQSTYTAPLANAPLQVTATAMLPGNYGYLYPVALTTILIDPPRAQITGTTPSVGHIGEPISFQGSGVTDRIVYAYFSAANGTLVQAGGPNVPLVVPHGAVSGPVWLELSNGAGGSTFRSAPYQLTILPRLRLHASRRQVSSGESAQIVAAAPDMPGAWKLNWRADLGSVDSTGMFRAPAVNQPTFARIWACLLPETECGTTIVEVLPFRLEPEPLILSPGETTQLKAWQGSGEISPTWQAVTANVSVTPSGALTAGKGPLDGGLAVVLATYGGVAQRLSFSIRTAGPVANAAEFSDWLGPDNNSAFGRLELGAFAHDVVVTGDWIYTLSSSFRLQNYGGPWLSTWLDAYQLDEHKVPVWVEAFEAPHAGVFPQGFLYREGYNLYAVGAESTGNSFLLHYSIDDTGRPRRAVPRPEPGASNPPAAAGGVPILRDRRRFDGSAANYRHEGSSFSVSPASSGTGPINLQILDYSTGTTRTLPLNFTPVSPSFGATAYGTANWVAIVFSYGGGVPVETDVFDISGTTAEPIALLASGGFNYSVTVLQDLLVVGPEVYQVKGNAVALVSTLDCVFVLDSDPATRRLLMEPTFENPTNGLRVVDLSDPFHPKESAPIVHSWIERYDTVAKLGPDYVALINGPDNVAVAPIDWSPGIRLLDQFPASPWMNDVRVRDGFAYWTGPGWGLAGRGISQDIFEVDDVSSYPATLVATMDRPGDYAGWAIELNGHYAYVGTDSELIVYDISIPAAPLQSTVIPVPAVSLARLGNYLYVGSITGNNGVLLVYDVSTAGTPRLVKSLPLPGLPYAVAAQPGWLAVAMGTPGLALYSLASPASPAFASQWGGFIWGVTGNGNLAYLAAGPTGLTILNLSDLRSPFYVSSASMASGQEPSGTESSPAEAISYDSRGIVWVYAQLHGDGLSYPSQVYGFDVRAPDRPRHIAQLVAGGANTTVLDDRLFVAGSPAAFDVTTPQNLGLYEVPQTSPGLVLPDRYSDLAPVAQSVKTPVDSFKAQMLKGGDRTSEPPPAVGQRPYRAEHPYAKPPLRPRPTQPASITP